MIVFQCTGCAKLFQVDESLGGRRSRCKQCGAVMKVPSAAGIPLLELPLKPPVVNVRPPRTASRCKPIESRRDAWISLGIGAVLAVVALVIPLAGFVVDVLITVIHELGHVATAWIFGSPALPSFDLAYGGGVSYTFRRQPILIFLVYAALIGLAFRLRGERTALVKLVAVVGLYSIAVFSPLRDVLITAMGHGAELVLAGVFLYLARAATRSCVGKRGLCTHFWGFTYYSRTHGSRAG